MWNFPIKRGLPGLRETGTVSRRCSRELSRWFPDSTADPYNLKVKHGRLDLRRNFFSIRVIEDWNRIPAEMKFIEKSKDFKVAY